MSTLPCYSCRRELPESAFSRSRTRAHRNWRQGRCRSCEREYKRSRRPRKFPRYVPLSREERTWRLQERRARLDPGPLYDPEMI